MPSHVRAFGPLLPLLPLFLLGCAEERLPEVSVENCKPEISMRIKDRDRRADFIDFCTYIPRSAWPIHPDKWLALSKEEHAQLQKASSRIGVTPHPLNWLSIKP